LPGVSRAELRVKLPARSWLSHRSRLDWLGSSGFFRLERERDRLALMPEEADYTLLAAVVFALIFIFGRWSTTWFERFHGQARSLGGGLAVSYAFLVLLPELEAGHALLGDSIHVVVLFGLLAFLGLERWIESQAEASGGRGADAVFGLTLGLAWIYVWLLVFTMPEKLEESWSHALIGIFGVGLHLVFKDHALHEAHEELHGRVGRFVLALAPIAGYVTETYLLADAEVITDLILALLAGSIFYEVFREELPSQRESRYGWFVAGTVIYSGLTFLAGESGSLSRGVLISADKMVARPQASTYLPSGPVRPEKGTEIHSRSQRTKSPVTSP
jgi:hypothetical protein